MVLASCTAYDVLIVKADRHEPLVVVGLSLAAQIAKRDSVWIVTLAVTPEVIPEVILAVIRASILAVTRVATDPSPA